jgi:hypothetical protein
MQIGLCSALQRVSQSFGGVSCDHGLSDFFYSLILATGFGLLGFLP